MNDTPLSDIFASSLNKGAALLRGVGRRILVHICALLGTSLVSLAAFAPPSLLDTFDTKLSIYIGLICLFPRGKIHEPSWYLPTGTGMAQGLLLIALGLAWPLAFFWGGLQTWLQRLLQSKGDLGWEWAVSPMLAMCLFDFFQQAPTMDIPSWPLWTVPGLALAAWLGRMIYVRLKAETIHQKMLEQALRRLRTLASRRTLSADMQQQVELLLVQGAAFSHTGRDPKSGYGIIARIDGVSRELEAFAATRPSQESNWPHRRLRSKRWQATGGQDATADNLLCAVREINALLLEVLKTTSPDASQDAPGDLDDRMNAYEESARQLLHKKSVLPEHSALHVEGIALSTFNIVQNMRIDPQDRGPGDRFLGRYLKAAHRIVDEYTRLAGEKTAQKEVGAALARSGEILSRLEQAFRDEHAGMLQNDAVNYTAELNALDSLLKMRGH